ncbi:MAG: hypothetical protein KGN33_10060, partial [Paracoccaceae bacterium]|nr:hypothetical protein [Paracoccaceae bacterium]
MIHRAGSTVIFGAGQMSRRRFLMYPCFVTVERGGANGGIAPRTDFAAGASDAKPGADQGA